MGKSPTFAVASEAPTPTAAAANQAVGLVERDAAPGERATPATCLNALGHPQRSETQAAEQPARVPLFAFPQPTPYLLDGDDAGPGLRARASQTGHALRGSVSTKRVDEHRRVQQHAGHRQPERRGSPRRCCRTHAAGSSSQSWPVSGRLPSAAWISSQRRSSSSPRSINAAMKALRRRAPARRSSSATRASSNAMCMRMGLR